MPGLPQLSAGLLGSASSEEGARRWVWSWQSSLPLRHPGCHISAPAARLLPAQTPRARCGVGARWGVPAGPGACGVFPRSPGGGKVGDPPPLPLNHQLISTAMPVSAQLGWRWGWLDGSCPAAGSGLESLSPTAFCQSAAIPELSRQQDLPSLCSGSPQDWLGRFWACSPGEPSPNLLPPLWGDCWRQPGAATAGEGPELRCVGDDRSGGDASVQQSSRKSPWPHMAFPCQLHFTWLPSESCSPARLLAAGQVRDGSKARQPPGSPPLLPAQPRGSGRADEWGRGMGPIRGRDGDLLFKAQHGAPGLVGLSRLECVPGGSLEQSELQNRALSFLGDC